MIAKEKPESQPTDRMRQAGDAAERQMAFYLRRRFGDSKAVYVFNDLRLEHQGEVAQIDHLLLHKHGLIIIESKSVTGEIQVNAQLEFVRVYARRKSGMPSPILQARRQAELLRQILQENKKELRSRRLLGLVQSGFKHCPIQVLVAISDQGVIKRPRKKIPELHKADQIADETVKIMERHRDAARLTSETSDEWGHYSFNGGEIERVVGFMKRAHAEQGSEAPNT